jgi:recF protein
MKIKKLKLRDFRNFENLELHFGENITILLGENAQGKTNILESVSYMSTTRSFRDIQDQQMIKKGKDFANIQIQYIDEKEKQLSSVIHKEGKSFLLFQNPITKTSEFIGLLSTLVFTPGELEIFNDAPRNRRRMMDVEIGKVSKKYLFHLKEYNQLLKERNKYLKEEEINRVYFDTLTERLIETMIPLLEIRKEFVKFLENNLESKFNEITQKKHFVKIIYETNLSGEKENYFNLFKKSEERDLQFKQTHLGIHRDDLLFYLDDKLITDYASQGQKRMVLLALKLSLIHYVEEMSGKKPVLLLDDVLSELDQKNRIRLFETIPKDIQTIITTTDIDSYPAELKNRLKIVEIKENKTFEWEERQ